MADYLYSCHVYMWKGVLPQKGGMALDVIHLHGGSATVFSGYGHMSNFETWVQMCYWNNFALVCISRHISYYFLPLILKFLLQFCHKRASLYIHCLCDLPTLNCLWVKRMPWFWHWWISRCWCFKMTCYDPLHCIHFIFYWFYVFM